MLRELDRAPTIYGGRVTAAMARSKLDEHRLQDVDVEDVLAGPVVRGGAVLDRDRQDAPLSIPDAFAVARTCELGTTLVTGDYKFDQTPVDGVPADVSRLAELGSEGLLLLCGDSTNADRAGFSPLESRSGRGSRRSSPAAGVASSSPASPPTSTACSRSWTRQASTAQGLLVGRSMRKNVNIGRMLGHIDVPEGILWGRARSRTSRRTSS